MKLSADHKSKLQHLWQRLVKGDDLEESDQQIASTLMTCEEPFAQFIGKLALVRGSSSKEKFNILERECSLGFVRAEEFALHLLIMLGSLPWEMLRNSKAIRAFAFAAARTGDHKAKLNAVHIVAAIASCDDLEARSLLEFIQLEKAADVRDTAAYYLSEIRKSGKVSRIF